MSTILRQTKTKASEIDKRAAIFQERRHAVHLVFEAKMGSIVIPDKDYKKYCYCLFFKDLLYSLDRTSQIIYYHLSKGIDLKVTATVTSLSIKGISRVCDMMTNEVYEMLDNYDYNRIPDRYWDNKKFIDHLIYSDKTDYELIELYDEEISVIKIMRSLVEDLFK